jgi:tetratricopeptide (TPR) repeat protein
MNKIGRNSACPCGSGKKFKRCCINILPATENENTPIMSFSNNPIEELEKMSNNARDFIKNGKLDKAELLAKKLIQEFPELHDGPECMAMICEAQKNYIKAEEYYKKSAHVVQQNGGYEPDFADFFINKAKEMRSKAKK